MATLEGKEIEVRGKEVVLVCPSFQRGQLGSSIKAAAAVDGEGELQPICFGGKWGEFLIVPSSRFTNGRLDSSNLLIAAGMVCALKTKFSLGGCPCTLIR